MPSARSVGPRLEEAGIQLSGEPEAFQVHVVVIAWRPIAVVRAGWLSLLLSTGGGAWRPVLRGCCNHNVGVAQAGG